MLWPWTASAASWSASDSVGCAWIVRIISSVVASSAEQRAALGDELGRVRADDVDAEDLVVLRVGDDLDEALRRGLHRRLREDAERELARS